jgi:hypothetical protein
VAIHLVGHSAGSIFHAALIQRLADANIPIESLNLLAAGIRVDEFERDILPHLTKKKTIARFTNFTLSDARELDDKIPDKGLAVYHKSALYLVSRGLELPAGRGENKAFEVPLVGMEKYCDEALKALLDKERHQFVASPASTAPPNSRSGALGHADFEDDPQTMTSVIIRILNARSPAPQHNYQKMAALSTGVDPEGGPLEEALPISADTQGAGAALVVETAEPQTQRPEAPAQPGGAVTPEVGVAPQSGYPIVDLLQADGWQLASGETAEKPARARPARKAAAKKARPKRKARAK